jgi:ATP-dependent Clp protease ATP-binding subunit ClpC
MWQRYSEAAKQAIFGAQDEACTHPRGYVSTEHLLLGLLREPENNAQFVLKRLGVDIAALRKVVRSRTQTGPKQVEREFVLTPRGKRVLDIAYDEVRNHLSNKIGTEHLLLGLIREFDGVAGQVLSECGVNLEQSRRMVLSFDGSQPDEHPKPRPPYPTSTWKHLFNLGDEPVFADWKRTPISEALKVKVQPVEKPIGKDLRLTKKQVEGIAQIGAELRKLMEK